MDRILLLVTLSTLASLPAAQTLDFDQTDVPAGDASIAVEATDLDGDGVLDLAVLDAGPSRVVALYGLGAGAFGAPSVLGASGSDARALVAADLDGDGLVDLAAASAGNDAVRVLRNLGGGAFAAPADAPAGVDPTFLAAADLDLDGDLDLVVPNDAETTLSILAGNGDATFQAPLAVPLGAHTGRQADVGDLDLDGLPDIAVGAGLELPYQFTSLVGTGGLSFTTHVSDVVTGNAIWVSIGEVDGDGLPDVVATLYSAFEIDAWVLPGNGDGTVAFPVGFGVSGYVPQVHELADLLGNGKLDMIGAASLVGSGAQVRLGTGTGLQLSNSLSVPAPASDLAVGDLDQDGRPDFAVACPSVDQVAVFLQRGSVLPTITSTTPPAMVALTCCPYVTLHGSGFDGFVEATVDGVPIPGGVVHGDGELDLMLPKPALGQPGSTSIAIGITTAFGQASIDVPLTPPDGSLVMTSDDGLSKSASPAEIYRGGGVGDLTFLVASPDKLPSSLPGVVDLAIGNDFQSLVFLGAKTIGAPGWELDSIGIANLPLGLTVNFQLAALPPGGSLPLLTSPVWWKIVGP